MKISEMVENLVNIMDEYGDLDCVYSIDDEGNDFRKVHYPPSVCVLTDDNAMGVDDEEFKDYITELEENNIPYKYVTCVN